MCRQPTWTHSLALLAGKAHGPGDGRRFVLVRLRPGQRLRLTRNLAVTKHLLCKMPGQRRANLCGDACSPWIKAALDSAAIDVEGFQNLEHLVHWQAISQSPKDDVEIFPPMLEMF